MLLNPTQTEGEVLEATQHIYQGLFWRKGVAVYILATILSPRIWQCFQIGIASIIGDKVFAGRVIEA